MLLGAPSPHASRHGPHDGWYTTTDDSCNQTCRWCSDVVFIRTALLRNMDVSRPAVC